MIEPCRYCASERVAAVLDKRMEKSPTAGNKYRKLCLACSRWLPMCGAADFQTADHQHVLPADADPDDEEPTVPAEEYDGPVDGLATAASGDDEAPTAMTDGGTDLDDQDDEEHVNEFDCPECGEHLTGYPDECPTCEVPYRWDDEDDEE